MESKPTRFISYRNGYYQGEVRGHLRNGYGILIVDEGPAIVGHWKDDLLEGQALAFLSSEQHGLLQFNRGQLDGTCIFRGSPQTLIIRMTAGQSIERQLLVNEQDNTAKVMTHRNGAYQVIDTVSLNQRSISAVASELLGLNIVIPSPVQFLQHHFCNSHHSLEIKTLPNATLQLSYRQSSSPLSLGFVINKTDQLTSRGCYIGQKLQGMGCKFDNGGRLEGEFYEGQLHGMGLKLAANKYSFGRFEQGALVDAVYMEERSPASEDKLKTLRKAQHLQSPHFFNGYLKQDLLHFNGISEVTVVSSGVKDLLYGVAALTQPPQSPETLKRSGVSLNHILSGSKQPQESRPPPLESRGNSDNKGLGGLLASREPLRGSNVSGRRFG